MNRRKFNFQAMALAGGFLIESLMPGCSKKTSNGSFLRSRNKDGKDQHPYSETAGFLAGTERSFPFLTVRGKPYEIGLQIGKRFADDIKKGFEKRSNWWKDLKTFADSKPALYETFKAAAEKYAPGVMEELHGWADGSGIPFKDLFILNLKAEYGALKDEADKIKEKKLSGCSTIALNDGNRILLAHNEDGDAAYLDHMFILKIIPEKGPVVLCASYPGILPGNAPWINSGGIAMTTNFIYSKKVNPGIGRYFLDRLSMNSTNLDEVIQLCKHHERAYSFHHMILSFKEKKIFSLEVTPDNYSMVEISGIFIHTNHLLSPLLSQEAQDLDYVAKSSMTRWNVLSKWKSSIEDMELSKIGESEILTALTSHEGRPYSPCRHPEGEITGATLLTTFFDTDKPFLRIYKKQPCYGRYTDYSIKSIFG